MKKIKYIIPIVLVIIILIVLFIIGNKSSNRIYHCSYSIIINENTFKSIDLVYDVTIDNNENVVNTRNYTIYHYESREQMDNAIDSFNSMSEIEMDKDYDNLTISIDNYTGEVINNDGEVINPNYLEYLNEYINENYECSFVK